MAYGANILRGAAAAESFRDSWNRLPFARGPQADIYDTHAWYSAWVAATGPSLAERCRTVVVTQGNGLAGVLPLLERQPRHWESVGRGNFRPRFRPTLGSETPPPEVLARMAEAVARAGIRRLSLARLPDRDPVTEALIRALREAGFVVDRILLDRLECLSEAADGWGGLVQRHKDHDRKVRNCIRKARLAGALEIEDSGAWRPEAGAREAELRRLYEIYLSLYPCSWKQAPSEDWVAYRRELLVQSLPYGAPRLFVLRLGGEPIAAHIWFRVGGVLISFSTVYNARFLAVGPGSILRWSALENLCAESPPPQIIDYLPGHGVHKEALADRRARLFALEAARHAPLLWSGRARRRVRSLYRRFRPPAAGSGEAPARPATRATTVRVELRRPRAPAVPVAPLDLPPEALMFLALAGGHASVQAMTARWSEGDHWWRLPGDVADGFIAVRVGAETAGRRALREIVTPASAGRPAEQIAAEVADLLGTTITVEVPGGPDDAAGRPVVVNEFPLPWPGERGIGGLPGDGPGVSPHRGGRGS